MTSLRVAVWGLGPHAITNILPALAAASRVEIAGVCSRNRDVVAATGAEYGCPTWASPADMLADRTIDAVYLATPIALHAQQGESVLRAGKHLWCEKPIAERAAQADALVALSRTAGVSVAEGFMYLFHPQFSDLVAVIESGRIGQPESIICRFGIPALSRASFRTDPALGGGAFLDVGSYPVSALVAVTSAPTEVVYAEIVTRPGSAVDTGGRALIRCGESMSALLEWRIETAYRSEIDVWGSTGSVFTERIFSKAADYVPRLQICDLRGNETVEVGRAANHFVRMLEAFRGLTDDAAGAERERELIVRRAELMDRIRAGSQLSRVR